MMYAKKRPGMKKAGMKAGMKAMMKKAGPKGGYGGGRGYGGPSAPQSRLARPVKGQKKRAPSRGTRRY